MVETRERILRSGEVCRNFIAFDTETTGLSPASDRIVELGAVIFRDGKPDASFSTLVNSGMPINAQASAVNGITNEMLADAPNEKDAYDAFTSFIKEALDGKMPIVAHNAKFDMRFLKHTFDRLGRTADLEYIDTLFLAKQRMPYMANYRQGTLADFFGIVNKNAHRACDDAITCGKIFVELQKK